MVPRRLTGKWRKRAMALPEFTIRQLMEAGVHFGHRAHLWNPKMSRYIYGTRNKIHIMDLGQTAPLLFTALKEISDTVAKGGRVLMVGTKRQAQDGIATAARESAQYFINARWLGGMLTNWQTVSQAIQRLRDLDEILSADTAGYTKKEMLNITRERDKLERNLGGIKDMGGIPDMLFVIDTNKEAIAIKEAAKLNIPVAAILDSNSNTDGVTYPIPGNDDAARSINLYCDLVSRAAIDGIERAQSELATEGDESSDEGGARRSKQRRQTKQRKIEISDGKATPKSTKDAKTEPNSKTEDGDKTEVKSESKDKKGATKTKSEKASTKKVAKTKEKSESKTGTKPEVKTKPSRAKETGTKETKTATKAETKPKVATTKKASSTAESKVTATTEEKSATRKTSATKGKTTANKETKTASSSKSKSKTTAASKSESS